ncbi:hypothetical protein Tco_1030750 [Tanacetum coccineum]|uniref:Reverse transcriptase domain-containing protein n=1 Tax=Tanacetum coccineum TaxID=301880 RepID=A0ABQ5G8S8_9ASTR
MIDRDKIMVAAGRNIMRKTPPEAYDLIENMTHHYFQWDVKVYYDTTTDMSAYYSQTTFASNEQVYVLGNDTRYTIQSVQHQPGPGHPSTFHHSYSDESDEDEPSKVLNGDILLLENLLNIDSTRDLPPQELNNEIYDAERDILLLEKLLNIDSTKYPPPQELNNDPEGDILFLETLSKDDPSDAENFEINSLIREPSDTFLMGSKEIEFHVLLRILYKLSSRSKGI